jgi:DNA-binding transcriptional MerR regulator
MGTEGLSIGAVAKAANVSVDAVRYYERSGLIPRAFRLPSGYRKFSATIISRIRLVKSLQRAGFTLAEVRELFQVVDAGERAWESFRPNLVGVLDRLTADLLALQRVERRLRRMLRFCDEGRCPFIREDAFDNR